METTKGPVNTAGVEEGMNRQSTEGFYSTEIFCMILLRRVYGIVHSPKSTESRIPKARSP